jgi:hypothetical protein
MTTMKILLESDSMKAKISIVLTAILCAALAAPAFAQSAKVEQNLQTILQRHPKLAANPSLVNNPTWQKNNPNVYAWFQHHPKAMRQTSHTGAWETNGTWHNPNWWFQNNPNWVYQNQPNWIQQNPNWRQQGDWYNGQWHNRNWYQQNQPEWARHHHPDWWAKEAEREHQGPPYGHAYGRYKHEHHEQAYHERAYHEEKHHEQEHHHDHHGDQH